MQEIKKCLIIDDDQDDQEIFLMCINQISGNITCLALDDSVEAVDMLASRKDVYIPHYIFIDVNMPKMSGIDCLRNLRNMEHLADSKIYMYSTTADRSTVEQSKILGASDFIIKPAKTAELKQILSAIFEIVS